MKSVTFSHVVKCYRYLDNIISGALMITVTGALMITVTVFQTTKCNHFPDDIIIGAVTTTVIGALVTLYAWPRLYNNCYLISTITDAVLIAVTVAPLIYINSTSVCVRPKPSVGVLFDVYVLCVLPEGDECCRGVERAFALEESI